jgi:hypothetical protein
MTFQQFRTVGKRLPGSWVKGTPEMKARFERF